MTDYKTLEKEIRNLEKQIAVVKKKFKRLQLDDVKSDRGALKEGDLVSYYKSPGRKGRVYKVTKFRVGVLYSNGELVYYKEKNLKIF